MDELAALRIAEAGNATFTTGLLMTQIGHQGLWEMELVGWEQVPQYVAHGNFLVDREGVFRSKLTKRGEQRLAELQGKGRAPTP